MPVGHTHGEVDQFFSVVASQVQKKEIPTVESLLEILKSIKTRNKEPIVTEMKSTTDYCKLMSPHLNVMGGQRDFFQFKIRKEHGETAMYVKASELDEDWVYPKGIKMFNDVPQVLNFQVSSLRELTDYTSIFDSVSKKYFPILEGRFSMEEAGKIKASWEKRVITLIEGINSEEFQPFELGNLHKFQRRKGFVQRTTQKSKPSSSHN